MYTQYEEKRSKMIIYIGHCYIFAWVLRGNESNTSSYGVEIFLPICFQPQNCLLTIDICIASFFPSSDKKYHLCHCCCFNLMFSHSGFGRRIRSHRFQVTVHVNTTVTDHPLYRAQWIPFCRNAKPIVYLTHARFEYRISGWLLFKRATGLVRSQPSGTLL